MTINKKLKNNGKKFVKIFINARTSRVSFDDLTIKKFSIFDFIDMYNHFMNDVDVIDQLRCYYDTQRIHLKIWKFLWHFLLNITMCNNYKIINIIESRSYAKLRKHDFHWLFRMKLIQKLYARFVRIAKSIAISQNYKRKKLIRLIRHVFSIKHEIRVRLSEQLHYCVSCSISSQIARKTNVQKFLQNLSMNSILTKKRRQKFFKIDLDCELCVMFICKEISCWREHLKICIASN